MPTPVFHERLREVRMSSRWPEATDFATRVIMSIGGYRKYESGERLPNEEALDRIFRLGLLSEPDQASLKEAWVEAKTNQAGIPAFEKEKKSVDVGKLAAHVHNEVLYVLKQDGVYPQERTRNVLLNRILILLRSKLEEQ